MMYRSKTIFSIMFIAIFLVGFIGILKPMATYADAVEKPQMKENEVIYYRDDESGHIHAEYGEREDSLSVYSIENGVGLASIPSSYESVSSLIANYPATRNQNPYGTCWAHSAVACAEFDMIKQHGFSKDVDFSELQLAYFMYNTANDKLGNLDGDQIYIPSGANNNFLDIGGSTELSMHILAQWKGLTAETTLPYSWANWSLTNNLSGYSDYNEGALLTGAFQYNLRDNAGAVKNAIMKYGAVSCAYYNDTWYYNNTGSCTAYYYPYSANTNHVVTLVGWDDYFSLYNFKEGYRPPNNGAWLVRNSWTTESGNSMYSYFWLSYYDQGLYDYATALNFVPGNTYHNIYQHDGSPQRGGYGVYGSANVFTASRNANGYSIDGYNSELLEAVSISSSNVGEKYKIQIYTGLTNSNNPTSGTLQGASTTYYTIPAYGVHGVKLNKAVPLKPGEKFSIVVIPVDGYAYMDYEYGKENSFIDSSGNYVQWYNTVASADSCESFYNSGNNWYDVTAVDIGNACIKGLTTNSSYKTYNITYKLNGGTNNSKNIKRYSGELGTFKLQSPTRKGYYFQGWYKDSSYKNKVTYVNSNLSGNVTLYAKWSKMDYSVKLGYTKANYTGKYKKPTVTVTDQYGKTLKSGTDYTVSYSNNKNVGRAKVSVVFKGLPYSLTKNAYFTIVPTAPATVSAKLYGYDDVKVSWSKVTGASGYTVYYKKANAESYTLYNHMASLSVKIPNLTDGAKYVFKVVPYYKTGDVRYMSLSYRASSIYTLKKINKPKLATSGTSVKVSWSNINGESGYQISRSGSKTGTNVIKTCTTTNGTYTLVSATKGKPYYYKVRAFKTVGNSKVYGPWSEPAKHTRQLPAPSSLTPTLYGYDDVKVSWSKVSGASGYALYYKKSTSSAYTLYNRTTGLSMKVANLTDGVKYNFKVVPYYKENGVRYASANYRVASIYTLKKISTPKVSTSGSNVKVSWSNINGESGYQISKSTSSTGTNIVYTSATTSGNYKLVSAAINTKYYYKVRAFKTAGNSKVYGPWSDAVAYTRKASAPQSLKAELTGWVDVKVSWKAASGAGGYKVYYKKSSDSSYELYTYLKECSVNIYNLEAGVKYDFKVVSCTVKNNLFTETSLYSTVSATTLKQTYLHEVKNRYTQGDDKEHVELLWYKVTGASGYEISQSTVSGGTNIVADYQSNDINAASIEANVLEHNYYKVRAYKLVNGVKIYSPWSREIECYTKPIAPEITGCEISLLWGSCDVTVNWKNVIGATMYEVAWVATDGSGRSGSEYTTGNSLTIRNLEDIFMTDYVITVTSLYYTNNTYYVGDWDSINI